jgi:hypothetical protein
MADDVLLEERLFAIIMVFCEASNIHYLWNKYFESMLED